jgi:hypothetical protein
MAVTWPHSLRALLNDVEHAIGWLTPTALYSVCRGSRPSCLAPLVNSPPIRSRGLLERLSLHRSISLKADLKTLAPLTWFPADGH